VEKSNPASGQPPDVCVVAFGVTPSGQLLDNGTDLRGGQERQKLFLTVPRVLEGQAIIDPSWVLVSRGDGRFDREFMIGATVPQFAAWIAGTVVGVLADNVVGDVERL
jgi:hypothetical protein